MQNVGGVQPLAVLFDDGDLVITSSPTTAFTISEQIKFFSWSPLGDQIAYVKNNSLFLHSLNIGQPRKLAEKVTRKPVWALEQQAIIFSGPYIHIATLDGMGTFAPTIPNGKPLSGEKATSYLWNPDTYTLLVRDEFAICTTPYCHDIADRYCVYVLSADLKTVTEQYFWEQATGEGLADIVAWRAAGKKAITKLGEIINIQPSDQLVTYKGILRYIYRNEWTLIIETDGLREKSISVNDLTQILDLQDKRIKFQNLEEGMNLLVYGREVFNSHGILAEQIQIITE